MLPHKSNRGVIFLKERDFFTGSQNPFGIISCMRYNANFRRLNPDYFEPDGIWTFCGAQGSGKTLSMVQTLLAVAEAYPKAQICSNLQIHGLDRDIIPFVDYAQISELTNGIQGIIFCIDEVQTIWNCMESRNIPISELSTLCQNRKDRRLVLCTSQVYGRVAKPIREQYKYVILCRNILKYIQFNTVVDPCSGDYTSEDDGHFCGEIVKKSLFFHSPRAYMSYDTYNKIERITRKTSERRYL